MRQLGTWQRDQSARSQAEEELYDFIVTDPALQEALQQYDAAKETLRLAYRGLLCAGAGQWESDVYVPVAALTRPETLAFVLCYAPRSCRVDRGWQLITTGLMDYFQGRDTRFLICDLPRNPLHSSVAVPRDEAP
jgi:hypothetical protein